MELLDSTVITTALPQMAESFHTAAIHLSAGVSAYMLALAVFIPLSGWMADRFGPRQVFGGALLMFAFASVLCSLSTCLAFFTAARILQGFSGAMMVPVGRMVVLRATPKERLVQAIATLTWPALAAPVLGPLLGGLITTHWGWHWIFLLNVPFGLLGFALTLWLVRGGPGGRRPFDGRGFLLSGLGCCALMFACDLASQTPFATLPFVASSLTAALALFACWRHLMRASHPLVELDALKIRTFFLAMRGGSFFRIAINSAPFLFPLMFQLAFGFSATRSGLLLLALFAGNLCMKVATTPLMRAWGFRTVLIANGILVALGFLLATLLTPQTPTALIMLMLFFTGLSRSMQFTALSTFSFCDVPDRQMSGASTLSSILTQMSAGLGVALGAIALRLASLAFPGEGHSLSATAFRISLIAMACLSALGLFDIAALASDAGARVSGHRPKK